MTVDNIICWENFWAQGSLTSLPGAFADNYAGRIGALWKKRFSALVDGSRILDIGTGNGAIALLAAAAAQQSDRHYSIDAVDLAKISPQQNLRGESRKLLTHIRFHPGTDAARTGFDNDSFDLVCGNFALEYCNIDFTVAELARITAPEGEHLFVMHHKESVLVDTAKLELGHIELLLNKTKLLQHAQALINQVGNVSIEHRQQLSHNPVIDQHRLAFNKAAQQVSDVIADNSHPELLRTALGGISEAYKLSHTQGRDAALVHLQQTRVDILDNAARLECLGHVAMSATGIEQLTELYRQHGFSTVEVDLLSESPAGLIAWVVRARAL